jgi:hypothetical protein
MAARLDAPSRAPGPVVAARPEAAPAPMAVAGGLRKGEVNGVRTKDVEGCERVLVLFSAAVAADPTAKPDARRLQLDAGLEGTNAATVRDWVGSWWKDMHEGSAAA